MKILITGVAGFIGFSLARKLLISKYELVGIDNINDYYDQQLKRSRLNILKNSGLCFHKIDISDTLRIHNFLNKEKFDIVIHLAAQAGVRYSINNPQAYLNSNINGFLNILEGVRNSKVLHLMYASSSSVYGFNQKAPFLEKHNTDEPVSFYAASKKSNEIMAHSYSHLYNIPCTGLRFFTVYGPWGRPDMAYFKFVKKILNSESIDIFGNGKMTRDFTYIDDVVDAIIDLIPIIPKSEFKKDYKTASHEIFNIGNNKSESLERFIFLIEKELGINAIRNYVGLQQGDVINTSADIRKINQVINFVPKISIEDGLSAFINWYKDYYK